jgi:hypothetical protein
VLVLIGATTDGSRELLAVVDGYRESTQSWRELLGQLKRLGLSARTGHDFSEYKRATILSGIARRMQVNGVQELPGYLSFVRTHGIELEALLHRVLGLPLLSSQLLLWTVRIRLLCSTILGGTGTGSVAIGGTIDFRAVDKSRTQSS